MTALKPPVLLRDRIALAIVIGALRHLASEKVRDRITRALQSGDPEERADVFATEGSQLYLDQLDKMNPTDLTREAVNSARAKPVESWDA